MDIVIKSEKEGIETAMIIKEKYNNPVVYVSAIDLANMERLKFTGPYRYVTKPILDTHLQIAIEIAYHKHQMDKSYIESYNSIFKMIQTEYPDVFNEINERFKIC
ncbi:MAG: hypothetical protein ACPK7O_04575 [Methanobacterium sp.]